MRKLTTEEFIERARKVHGDKYDYSKTLYIKSHSKLTITCKVHGDFTQKGNDHLNGSGCRKCGGTRLKTKEQFVSDAVQVHGYKYNYENTIYKGNTVCIVIICPEHGEFWQTPSIHLDGSGCPKCGDESRRNQSRLTVNNKRDWNFEQPEEYKLIPLTKGKFAKVDNEDFDKLKDINWCYGDGGKYVFNRNLGKLHRYLMKAPKGKVVDHINHDTLDNRRSNLRLCSKSQNAMNTKKINNCTSIFKGVYYNSRVSKYISRIKKNGKDISLGYFDDEISAGKAYDLRAVELFGEFAYLNFPELRDEYEKQLGFRS